MVSSISRAGANFAAALYKLGTGVAQYHAASHLYIAVVPVMSSAPFIILSTLFIKSLSSADSFALNTTSRVARSGTELEAVPPFEII